MFNQRRRKFIHVLRRHPGLDKRGDFFQHRTSHCTRWAHRFQVPLTLQNDHQNRPRSRPFFRKPQNSDQDQHACAAEEGRHGIGNLQFAVQPDRNQGNDGQKDRASQCNPAHGIVQIIARRLPRAHPRNVATVLLQIIRDLKFVELGCHPEIREEQNHQPVQRHVKNRPFSQRARDLAEELDVEALSQEQKDLLREHQNGLGKNDWHHTRVVDSQRHKRGAARIDFATYRPLRVLDRDLPLGLSDGYDPGYYSGE